MDYFDRLEAETHHLYEIANEAINLRMVYPTDKIPFPWKKSPNLMAISPIPGKRTSLKLAWQIK